MKNRFLLLFDSFLLLFGIIIFLFVFRQSYRQFANHKLNISVDGFVLNTHNRYTLTGFLDDENFATTDKFSENSIKFDKALPFVGTFSNSNQKWSFVLSKNIFSERTKTDNNILFPRAFLYDARSKYLIEPLSTISEDELLNKKIEFEDRVSGQVLLRVWCEKKNGVLVARTSSIAKAPLNLLENGKSDTVKIFEKNKFEISDKDPLNLLYLPARSDISERETLIKIERNSATNYTAKFSEGTPQNISRSSNEIIWNGWLISFLGIYSFSHAFFFYLLLLIGLGIFIFLMKGIINDDKFHTRSVETRVLRIFAVYMLFSVLSLIFINHTRISNDYSRAIGFGFMLFVILCSWILFPAFVVSAKNRKFLEAKKFNKFSNIFSIYQGNVLNPFRYRFFYFLFLIFTLIIGYFAKNERLPILGTNIGIPVLHIAKIYVCLIVFLFRKSLFKGDWRAHFFLWSNLLFISFITGDFSSLIFSAISYTFVSLILTKKLVLPNFFKFLTWKRYYNQKNNDEVPQNLRSSTTVNTFYFLIIAGFLAVSYYFHYTKTYRFKLPYTSPDSESMIDLANMHKETYAKMFWSVDYIINHFSGEWRNFRVINFFTTWHTDLAFLSWLQYGGYKIFIVLLLLFAFILFDSFYLVFSTRKLINSDVLEKLKNSGNLKFKKAYQIIEENIFVYFLIVYLLIQTFYPILSNLNVVPIIGAPIPCLSVSLVEYLLTSILLCLIYFYSGRLFHHNDILLTKDYNKEETSIEGKKFQNIILEKNSEYSFLFAFSVLFVFFILFKVTYNLFGASYAHSEKYELKYNAPENEKVVKTINSLNDTNASDEIEAKKNLIKIANKNIENIKWYDKFLKGSKINNSNLINEVRKFVFEKDFVGKSDSKPIFAYNDEEKNIYLDKNSMMKNRRIFRSSVLENMSFKNFFKSKTSTLIGDEDLNYNTRILVAENKLMIKSTDLNMFENNFIKSVGKDGILPNDNYIYDALKNYIYYKNLNGQKIKVLAFSSIGDIDLTSNTFDADLQAITTLFLSNYLSKSPEEMKISGAVIAENKTGKVVLMASAPNYANKFGTYFKEDIEKLKKVQTTQFNKQNEPIGTTNISLFSHIDENGFKNFALSEAMIGSTVKPLYTFSALNDKKFNPNSIPIREFIKTSNDPIATTLFTKEYQNEEFQKNLYNYFNMRMFDSVKYKKTIKDSSNYLITKSTIIAGDDLFRYTQKHSLGYKQRFSAAVGQGSINMSLTSLVNNYIRLNERNSVVLTLHKDGKYIIGKEWVDKNKIELLYQGMQDVISSGTASSTIGNALRKNKLDLKKYKGKTGTVQFSGDTQFGREEKNKVSYMVLVTPNYTIGISLFGILPNGGKSNREDDIKHAKGILSQYIDLLAHWRKGKYLN